MSEQITPVKKALNLKTQAQEQIAKLTEENKINIPANYSVGNALMQMQLIIQDDKELISCTNASLIKCMTDMCILGLNPAKQQCYFVKFGDKATLMRSYEGNKVLAKRINPNIVDIVSRTVHKGEEFEWEDLSNGYSKIITHKRTLSTMVVNNPMEDIVGAYATLIMANGEELSLVMPFSEIIKRWNMNRQKPLDDKGNLKPYSVHAKFPDRMAERTVVNAICNPIIRGSDDNDLFGTVVQTNYMETQKVEADMEANENMCQGEFVDIEADFTEVEETETVEVPETSSEIQEEK